MVSDPSIPQALRIALDKAIAELQRDIDSGDLDVGTDDGRRVVLKDRDDVGTWPDTARRNRPPHGLSLTLREVVEGSTTSERISSLARTNAAFWATTVGMHLRMLEERDADTVVLAPANTTFEQELAGLTRCYVRVFQDDGMKAFASGSDWNVTASSGRLDAASAPEHGMDASVAAALRMAPKLTARMSRYVAGNFLLEAVSARQFLHAWRTVSLDGIGIKATTAVEHEIAEAMLEYETSLRRRRRGLLFPLKSLTHLGDADRMMADVPLWMVGVPLGLSKDTTNLLFQTYAAVLTLKDLVDTPQKTIGRILALKGAGRRNIDEILEAAKVVEDRIRRYEATGVDEALDLAGRDAVLPTDAFDDAMASLGPTTRRVAEAAYGLYGRQRMDLDGIAIVNDLTTTQAQSHLAGALRSLRNPAFVDTFERIMAENDAEIEAVLTEGVGVVDATHVVERVGKLPPLLRLSVDVVAHNVNHWISKRATRHGWLWVLKGNEIPEFRTGLPKRRPKSADTHPVPLDPVVVLQAPVPEKPAAETEKDRLPSETIDPVGILALDFADVARHAGMRRNFCDVMVRKRPLPTLYDYVVDRDKAVKRLRKVQGIGIVKERILLAAAARMVSVGPVRQVAAKMKREQLPPSNETVSAPRAAVVKHPFVKTERPREKRNEKEVLDLFEIWYPELAGTEGFDRTPEWHAFRKNPPKARSSRFSWTSDAAMIEPPDVSDERSKLAEAVAALSQPSKRIVEGLHGLDGSEPLAIATLARELGLPGKRCDDIRAVALHRLTTVATIAASRRILSAGSSLTVSDDPVERLAEAIASTAERRGRRVLDYRKPEPPR